MIDKIETILTIRDIQYQVNWDLKQVNVLVGENGSGKTRLLTDIVLNNENTYCIETVPFTLKSHYYGILYVGLSILSDVAVWYKELTDKQIHLDFSEIDYLKLSKGERYLLDLLANIYVRPRNSTVLIDDIEQNLHISIRNKLLDFLMDKRPDLQFIITTHCPDFIGGHWNSVTEIHNILT